MNTELIGKALAVCPVTTRFDFRRDRRCEPPITVYLTWVGRHDRWEWCERGKDRGPFCHASNAEAHMTAAWLAWLIEHRHLPQFFLYESGFCVDTRAGTSTGPTILEAIAAAIIAVKEDRAC